MTKKPATNHWLIQQITSIIMIPLSLFMLYSFMSNVVFRNGYDSSIAWLKTPLNAIAMIIMILVAAHHGSNGVISGIFEDYVHHRGLNMIGVTAVKISALALMIVGTLSVAVIYFGV